MAGYRLLFLNEGSFDMKSSSWMTAPLSIIVRNWSNPTWPTSGGSPAASPSRIFCESPS